MKFCCAFCADTTQICCGYPAVQFLIAVLIEAKLNLESKAFIICYYSIDLLVHHDVYMMI